MTLLHWLAYPVLFAAGYGLGRLETSHPLRRGRYLERLRDHAESVHVDK